MFWVDVTWKVAVSFVVLGACFSRSRKHLRETDVFTSTNTRRTKTCSGCELEGASVLTWVLGFAGCAGPIFEGQRGVGPDFQLVVL